MKLTDNCYAILGLGYSPPWVVNSGFAAGSGKTIIIDSGPMYLAAQTIYGYAKSVRPDNELIVINTEKHFDHIGGNSFFKEKGINIYAHADNFRTEDEFTAEKKYFNQTIDNKKRSEAGEEEIFFQNTFMTKPNSFLKDGEVFELGSGLEAKIIFTNGHTPANISVYIPCEKVLYSGDCIVSGYIPNLEAGTKNDWKVWSESLDRILSLEIDYIVPGHGDIICGPEIEKSILRMKEILGNAVVEGKAPTAE